MIIKSFKMFQSDKEKIIKYFGDYNLWKEKRFERKNFRIIKNNNKYKNVQNNFIIFRDDI